METNKWREDEITFLKDNQKYMTNEVLSNKLNRTKNAVKKKRFDLGLKRDYELCEYTEGKIINNQYNNSWTEEEIKILEENHNNKENRELKEMLPKRTIGSISTKLNLLRLKRDEDFIKEIYKRRSGINHPNYGKKLNLDRIKQIKDRNSKKLDMNHIKQGYLFGKSIEVLSKELKVSCSTIWKKLKEMGVKTRGHGLVGRNVSVETRQKIRDANLGKKQSEETKMKIRESRSNQIFPLRDSSIEKKISNFLKVLGINFLPHKYIKIDNGYQCDFFIPSMNLVIEADGDYWHEYPIGLYRDLIRTFQMNLAGYRVIRLWEHEINNMNVEDFNRLLFNKSYLLNFYEIRKDMALDYITERIGT